MYGDGVVKAAPEPTVCEFRFVRRSDGKVRERENGGFSARIKKGFLVCAVVEEKGFVVAPLTKMPAQEGEDAVFGFDFRGQKAADVGETDKAAVLFQFPV